jgi:broad specificity phosphatase PhoE
MSVAAVFTSPQRRAVDTATPLAAALGTPMFIDDRLRERINWDGGATVAVDDFLDAWEQSTTDRDYASAFGDSSRQAAARFRAFLVEISDRHHHDTVAVVSHGGVTVDLLRDIVGDSALERTAPGLIDRGVPGCAVTRLSVHGDTITATDVAVIDHVAKPDRSGHEA